MKTLTVLDPRAAFVDVGSEHMHVSVAGDEPIGLGEAGAVYRLQVSEALPTWNDLATLTNTFGSTEFTDASVTNRAHRFYRAVSPP